MFKLATQYPSNRSSRPSGDYGRASAQPGISRSGAGRGGYGSRPAAGRSQGYGGARPSGQRGYSQGAPRGQYAGNRRPSTGGNRRPASGGSRRPPRRRKPQGRFFAFIAVAVLLVLLAVIFVPKLFGGGSDKPVPAEGTPAAPAEATPPSPQGGTRRRVSAAVATQGL